MSQMTLTQRLPVVRVVAVLMGVFYLLMAVIGFSLTGLDPDRNATILVFAVNLFHNVVHLTAAVTALACCRSERASEVALLVIGVLTGLVTVLGFLGWLPVLGMHHGIAEPDNFLHLVTAVLALVTALLYGPSAE